MNELSNNCPAQLRVALCELLHHTTLQIRMNCSDAKAVFAHADHVHNIPTMLIDFHPEQLALYWESDRLSFLQLLPHGNKPSEIFHSLWASIEQEYQRICKPGPSGK